MIPFEINQMSFFLVKFRPAENRQQKIDSRKETFALIAIMLLGTARPRLWRHLNRRKRFLRIKATVGQISLPNFKTRILK
jgi:hypothetical protein